MNGTTPSKTELMTFLLLLCMILRSGGVYRLFLCIIQAMQLHFLVGNMMLEAILYSTTQSATAIECLLIIDWISELLILSFIKRSMNHHGISVYIMCMEEKTLIQLHLKMTQMNLLAPELFKLHYSGGFHQLHTISSFNN